MNEPPIDITLKKSSSGTWEVPESPRRRLEPWQRLWFISGIIYLLMLAGSYYILMPDQESIERHMVFSVTEEVRRYDGMAFAGESPRKIFENARSLGYAPWIAATRVRFRIGPEGNAGFDRIEKNYHVALSDLPVKRIVGVLVCAVVWLLPMGVLYAIGSVVEWIKRGTRAIRS
jgi:hypothetical protein